MTRRSLFATLLAPLVAKFARKPKFESGCAIAHAYKEAGHTFYVTEFWPRENPYIYFMGPLQDFDFLAGHYRTASVDQGRQCNPINRLREELESSLAASDVVKIMNPDGACRTVFLNRTEDPATVDLAYREVNKMLDRWNKEPL